MERAKIRKGGSIGISIKEVIIVVVVVVGAYFGLRMYVLRIIISGDPGYDDIIHTLKKMQCFVRDVS